MACGLDLIELRVALLAALVLGTGCDPVSHFEPQDPGDRLGSWTPDPSATILRTALTGLDNLTVTVVSDAETWRALWSQTWGNAQAMPNLPGVDFVLSSVIVVGLGTRPSLGYSVTIDSVVVRTVGAVLYATETQPNPACPPATATSAPVHIVLSPGHPPVIDWHLQTIRGACPP